MNEVETRLCIYAEESEDAVMIDGRTGEEMPCTVTLCCWALYSPEAQDKLIDTPRWLQNQALSGYPLGPDDCRNCPCFKAPG